MEILSPKHAVIRIWTGIYAVIIWRKQVPTKKATTLSSASKGAEIMIWLGKGRGSVMLESDELVGKTAAMVSLAECKASGRGTYT